MKAFRVVATGVFLDHVSGNVMSSVFAIAGKAADSIKEDSPIFKGLGDLERAVRNSSFFKFRVSNLSRDPTVTP